MCVITPLLISSSLSGARATLTNSQHMAMYTFRCSCPIRTNPQLRGVRGAGIEQHRIRLHLRTHLVLRWCVHRHRRTAETQALIEATWIAYVAGLFDGEGTVTIGGAKRRRNDTAPDYRLAISISQRAKDRAVLDRIQASFGGSVRERTRGPKVARTAEWQPNKLADAVRFLTAIAPYVQIKAPQVRLALEYMRTRTLAPYIPIHDVRGHVKGRERVSQAEVDLRRSFRERMQYHNRVGPQVDVREAES